MRTNVRFWFGLVMVALLVFVPTTSALAQDGDVFLPTVSGSGTPGAQLVSADNGDEPAEPNIQPSPVERLIFPGVSTNIVKTVTTPEILPKPDIYILADSTGSMGSVLAQVQTDAASLLAQIAPLTNDPRFGAGDYRDFQDPQSDPYAFNNGAPIPATDDGGAAALAAISAWSTVPGAGGDGSEGQFFALDQIAEGVVNWRGDSTKIVVWFGDAPGHDPVCQAISGLGYEIDEASLTAKLVAAEIRVIAIGTTTNYGQALNDDPTTSVFDYVDTCSIGGASGQATRIAAATGGVSIQDVAPADITQAILDGLTALLVDVSMESTCSAPIGTSFVPSLQSDVTSGENAFFAETISVAAGAAGGTYICADYATINGEDMVDSSGELVTEDKTIHVPGIDLTPKTDTNELGFDLDHTVIATVSAGSYGPVSGVRVEFDVTGQNPDSGTGVTDGAGQAPFTYAPPVEPDSLGSDSSEGCFTDALNTIVYGCDTVSKEWVDTTPPEAFCVPGVNPAGKEPNAPGEGGQGQNQDGFYLIGGDDIVWPDDSLEVFVTDTGSGTVFGPYPVGTNIKYVEAPGAEPSVKAGSGEVDWMIKGTGDAEVTVVDGSGNLSDPATCLVPPPPK